MSNVCELCAQLGDLRKSHILPHFFGRLALEFSGAKALAHPDDPSQQGPYWTEMLCGGCEKRLNERETPARPIMHEALKSSAPVPPSDTFDEFCASLALRCTLTEIKEFPELGEAQYVKDAIERWRCRLLGLPHAPDEHFAVRLYPCKATFSDGTAQVQTAWSGMDGGVLSGNEEVAFARLRDLLILSPCTTGSLDIAATPVAESSSIFALTELPTFEPELWTRMIDAINDVRQRRGLEP